MSESEVRSFTTEDFRRIREQADLLLRCASAYDRFPTPVDDLVAAARLTVASDVSLDTGFLSKIYRNVTQGIEGIKRALEKVLGLLDTREKTIYLDQTVLQVRKNFIKLHEAGHGFLPWQKDAFTIVEDGEASLDPEIREEFEREASIFASEVLFQCGRFEKQCCDLPFGLKTPINLSKSYSASCYAAIRRYVSTHHRACAVFVFNQPVYSAGEGYKATVRRTVESEAFRLSHGKLPDQVGIELQDLVTATAQGKSPTFADPCTITLQFDNGQQVSMVAEAFNSTYQVFVLVIPEQHLNTAKRKLWLPKQLSRRASSVPKHV
ncbi:MAG: ImmA/IrrE family metallo-endopeptidase [Armatimonadota bacterium]